MVKGRSGPNNWGNPSGLACGAVLLVLGGVPQAQAAPGRVYSGEINPTPVRPKSKAKSKSKSKAKAKAKSKSKISLGGASRPAGNGSAKATGRATPPPVRRNESGAPEAVAEGLEVCGALGHLPSGKTRVEFDIEPETGVITGLRIRGAGLDRVSKRCIERAVSRATGKAWTQPTAGATKTPARRSLTSKDIRAGMTGPKKAAQACAGAEPGHRVDVKLTIEGATGTVTAASIVRGSLSPGFDACVLKAVEVATFPPTTKPGTRVTYPIRF